MVGVWLWVGAGRPGWGFFCRWLGEGVGGYTSGGIGLVVVVVLGWWLGGVWLLASV